MTLKISALFVCLIHYAVTKDIDFIFMRIKIAFAFTDKSFQRHASFEEHPLFMIS